VFGRSHDVEGDHGLASKSARRITVSKPSGLAQDGHGTGARLDRTETLDGGRPSERLLHERKPEPSQSRCQPILGPR
jgi:hypothetical protein